MANEETDHVIISFLSFFEGDPESCNDMGIKLSFSVPGRVQRRSLKAIIGGANWDWARAASRRRSGVRSLSFHLQSSTLVPSLSYVCAGRWNEKERTKDRIFPSRSIEREKRKNLLAVPSFPLANTFSFSFWSWRSSRNLLFFSFVKINFYSSSKMKEINSKEKKEINGGKMSSLMKRKRSPHVSFHYLVAIICFPSSGTPFLSLSFDGQLEAESFRTPSKGERKAFTIVLQDGAHILFIWKSECSCASARIQMLFRNEKKCPSWRKDSYHRHSHQFFFFLFLCLQTQ